MHLRNSRWRTYFSESSNEAWFVKIFSHTLGKVGAAIVVSFFAAVFLYAPSERRQSQTAKNTTMITEDDRRFEYPTTSDQDPMPSKPMPSKPMPSKIERNRSHEFDGSTTLLESYEHFMAMSESPRARLGLYETLNQCGGFGSVRSVEEFDKLVTSDSNLNEATVDRVRKKFLGCLPLLQRLGDVDLRERASAWIASAADQGYPVAILISAYEYPSIPRLEDVLPSVYESLALAEDDPSISGRVYELVLYVYGDFIDSQAKEIVTRTSSYEIARSDTERDAWEYLACEKQPTCKIEEFLDLFDRHFKPYQKDAMIKRASELQSHIRRGEWEQLGLDPR